MTNHVHLLLTPPAPVEPGIAVAISVMNPMFTV